VLSAYKKTRPSLRLSAAFCRTLYSLMTACTGFSEVFKKIGSDFSSLVTLSYVRGRFHVVGFSVSLYSSRHQIAFFKATEELYHPYRAALCQPYSVASFATVRVLNCLHSPGLSCSCCNGVRFCCGLEACNLEMVTIPPPEWDGIRHIS
jgi:hypothetical protein